MVRIDINDMRGLSAAFREHAQQKWSFHVGNRAITLFYTVRIKAFLWTKLGAYFEVLLNLATVVMLLIALAGGNSSATDGVGAAAIFIASMYVHWTYGFAHYPSLARCCLLNAEERTEHDEEFEAVRDIFGALYNGPDCVQYPDQTFTHIAALPFTIYIHLVAILASYACCLVGCFSSDKNDKRSASEKATENAAMGGFFGILLASVFFPLLFMFGGPAFKLYATLGLLVTEEYYTALLFRKPFFKFLLSVVFGQILDVFEPSILGLPTRSTGADPASKTEASAADATSAASAATSADLDTRALKKQPSASGASGDAPASSSTGQVSVVVDNGSGDGAQNAGGPALPADAIENDAVVEAVAVRDPAAAGEPADEGRF